jgi:hypothetical protein
MRIFKRLSAAFPSVDHQRSLQEICLLIIGTFESKKGSLSLAVGNLQLPSSLSQAVADTPDGPRETQDRLRTCR